MKPQYLLLFLTVLPHEQTQCGPPRFPSSWNRRSFYLGICSSLQHTLQVWLHDSGEAFLSWQILASWARVALPRGGHVLPVRPSTIHLELELEYETESLFLVEEVLDVILGTCSLQVQEARLKSAYMGLWDFSKKFSHYQPRLDAWDKCSGLVHWEDPERWDGEGGGRGDRDGEHMYIHGWFMSMYGKNHYNTVK